MLLLGSKKISTKNLQMRTLSIAGNFAQQHAGLLRSDSLIHDRSEPVECVDNTEEVLIREGVCSPR